MQIFDQPFLTEIELLKLLIEMPGGQNHRILQLALTVDQRAVLEATGHGRGPDSDRRY